MIEPFRIRDDFYRGPVPQRIDDFYALKKLGIGYVLALSDHYEFEGNFWCVMLKIARRRFHLGAILPPSRSEVEMLLALIDARSEPLYLHCKDGVDRTGFIVAKWRIRQGWTKKEARKEMIQMGNHWRLRWWTWFL